MGGSSSKCEALRSEIAEQNRQIRKMNNNFLKEVQELNEQIQDKELLREELNAAKLDYTSKIEKMEQEQRQFDSKYKSQLKETQQKFKKDTKTMTIESKKQQIVTLDLLINSMYQSFNKDRANLQIKYNQELFPSIQAHDIEKKRLQIFSEELKDLNILRLVFIGVTGHGKSSVCNRLSKQWTRPMDEGYFKVGDGAQSETQTIRKLVVNEVCDRRVCIVDTPGIFDSQQNDFMHANNLISYLRGCGGVNTFIVVKTRHPPRLDDCTQKMLQNLHEMLGDEFWSHVIFLMTGVESSRHKKGWSNYSLGFINEVKRQMTGKCNMDFSKINLPIFGIGNYLEDGNFKEVIPELLNAVPSERFECTKLKSPLDELEMRIELNKRYLDGEQALLLKTKGEIESCKDERQKLVNAVKRGNGNYKPPPMTRLDLKSTASIDKSNNVNSYSNNSNNSNSNSNSTFFQSRY